MEAAGEVPHEPLVWAPLSYYGEQSQRLYRLSRIKIEGKRPIRFHGGVAEPLPRVAADLDT